MENIEVGMVVRVSGVGVGEVDKIHPFIDSVIVKMDNGVFLSFTEKEFNGKCSNIDFDSEGWI